MASFLRIVPRLAEPGPERLGPLFSCDGGVAGIEPESANAALLERSAERYRRRGADWRVRQTAVGAQTGEAELHVLGSSWAHALHPPAEFSRYEVGRQHVLVESAADVLAEGAELAAGGRLVVKVNAEGEECAIVLGTPVAGWTVASEVFVEVHPWASCTADELVAHDMAR